GTSNTKHDWTARIIALRKHLQVSQSELGRRVNSSAMAVSRWGRGIQEPPAHVYIQLGNLRGGPGCWYFWGRAGLHTEDFMRVLPLVRSRLRKDRVPKLEVVRAGVKRMSRTENLVALPLLPVTVAAIGGKGDPPDTLDRVAPEAVLAAPHAWCPN